jgi:hypothetical protein
MEASTFILFWEGKSRTISGLESGQRGSWYVRARKELVVSVRNAVMAF